MIIVYSYFEFLTKAQHADDVLLLICKPNHEQSQIASRNLEIAFQSDRNAPIFKADSNSVPEVNIIYELDVFPSLIIFKQGKYIKTIPGCREAGFYASILEDNDKGVIANRKNSSIRVIDPVTK